MSTVSEECSVIQRLNSRGNTVGSDRMPVDELDVLVGERLGFGCPAGSQLVSG